MSGGLGGLDTARYFLRTEDRRIDNLLLRRRRRMDRKTRRIGSDQQALVERLDEMEADLGQVLLVAMSVNRLLVRKGTLHPNEIGQVARELDLADGKADGKLDPAAVRPRDAAVKPPAAPEEFLRGLEKED